MSPKSLLIAFSALLFMPFSVLAQSYEGLIDEAYLRETFTFNDGESLKYAECEVKTVFTCTYVWGTPSGGDASLVNLGLAPSGNRIMAMFAESSGMDIWPLATKTYQDGEEIAGLGQAAMWSAQRGQLTFMSPANLVVHINIGDLENGKESATTIAQHILDGLEN